MRSSTVESAILQISVVHERWGKSLLSLLGPPAANDCGLTQWPMNRVNPCSMHRMVSLQHYLANGTGDWLTRLGHLILMVSMQQEITLCIFFVRVTEYCVPKQVYLDALPGWWIWACVCSSVFLCVSLWLLAMLDKSMWLCTCTLLLKVR